MNHTFKWQGRHDGDGEAHQRIHHIMNKLNMPSLPDWL
jgi:formiminoglutamase